MLIYSRGSIGKVCICRMTRKIIEIVMIINKFMGSPSSNFAVTVHGELFEEKANFTTILLLTAYKGS